MKLKSVQALTAAALVLGAITLVGSTSAMARGGPDGGERPSFQELNANNDGVLTLEDFAAMKAARFAEADTNNDGSLSVDELTAQAEARAAKHAEERATKMMERHDANNDGLLSAAELEDGGKKGDRGERMFERMDANADGQISEEEFEEMASKFKGRKGHKKSSE